MLTDADEQPAVELLRQLVDTDTAFRPGGALNPPLAGGGGFYDRRLLSWTNIENALVVAACAPPGGGRNAVTPRFFRHLHMLGMPAPSRAALKVRRSLTLACFCVSIRIRQPTHASAYAYVSLRMRRYSVRLHMLAFASMLDVC
jgi:hypothetical protein